MTTKNYYSNYEAMLRHPNFYQNLISKKIIFKKNISGKTVKISCKTTSISEAKAFVDLELIKLYSANPKDEIRKKKGLLNPTLLDIWTELVEERKISSEISTLKGYRTSWKYGIGPFWQNLTSTEITPITVTKFENWYLSTYPSRVFFDTGKHLNMLFNYMVKQGLLGKAPRIRDLDTIIKKKTKSEDVGRVYTTDEISSLLKNAINKRTRLAIMIYAFMGALKMEILSSERSRWDLKNKVVKIWSSKNKNWREIAIPNALVPEIENHIEREPESKFLFCAPTDPNRHVSGQVFDKSWTKTKVKAELHGALKKNGARVHDLRHTFATSTALNSWPIMVACKVLDMSPEEYAKTYVHISKEDISLKMNSIRMVLK